MLVPPGSKSLTEDSRADCPPDVKPKVIQELKDIYSEKHALGMAAPQIGYPYNVFIALGEIFEGIIDYEGIGEKVKMTEGCFSTEGLHLVERYPKITVIFKNERKVYSGRIAQVIQHEFDHIKGKLICSS